MALRHAAYSNISEMAPKKKAAAEKPPAEEKPAKRAKKAPAKEEVKDDAPDATAAPGSGSGSARAIVIEAWYGVGAPRVLAQHLIAATGGADWRCRVARHGRWPHVLLPQSMCTAARTGVGQMAQRADDMHGAEHDGAWLLATAPP